MSVLVKDMRFPNYCSDCEFSKPWGNSGTYCSRYPWKDDVKYWKSKPDWCPLVEIPTPNGRLIDEEAVVDHFVNLSNNEWNQNVCTSWANAFAEAASDICDIPTIIQAEEGD